MHNSLNIGTQFINQQVHGNFARNRPPPADMAAFQVHDHHVRGAHHALAHRRRGGQNPPFIEANGKVAVHGSDKAAFVEHAPVTDNFFPMFAFRRHGYPWGEKLRSRLQLTFAYYQHEAG